MELNIKLKVKPFRVPNYVLVDRYSSDPSNDTKFHLKDLDVDTLEKLCEQFIHDVFKKAGKENKKLKELEIK